MSLRRKGALVEAYAPCPHLLDYRAKHGARRFRIVQRRIRTAPLGRASLASEGSDMPHCATCSASHGRLYACLLCAAVDCWMSRDTAHACSHAQAKPGHDIAVDVDRAELFCCSCGDQVYDLDFDRTVIGAQSAIVRSDRKHRRGEVGFHWEDLQSSGPETRRKRRRAEYRPWDPTLKEQLLLRRGSTSLDGDFCLPWGLRGLNNLGNTCFMNSVLQALLHTPPLRNYFLSDWHSRVACQERGMHLCLGCDMDTIYSAAFSGERMPYSPAQFLHSWWQHASNLAGYQQQDAHEFFISTIEGIHANVGRPSLPAGRIKSAGDGDCECIAHQVFSGLLRSDITCTVCGCSSTTYDPCVDISLDLDANATEIKGQSVFCMRNGDNGHSANGAQMTSLDSGVSTLYGCLDRFTRPERLGSNEKFYCQNCQVQQEFVKQMSLRKLPLVLCLHIKRFEHSSVCNMSRKLDRYVQFPTFLNMAPYLSSTIVRVRHGNRLPLMSGDELDSSVSFMSPPEFELFAVITHSGKLDSGHYITYLQIEGEWYKCDDSWVTQVKEDVVRASQGYMLYYVQKTFSYKGGKRCPEKASGDSNGKHIELNGDLANGH